MSAAMSPAGQSAATPASSREVSTGDSDSRSVPHEASIERGMASATTFAYPFRLRIVALLFVCRGCPSRDPSCGRSALGADGEGIWDQRTREGVWGTTHSFTVPIALLASGPAGVSDPIDGRTFYSTEPRKRCQRSLRCD